MRKKIASAAAVVLVSCLPGQPASAAVGDPIDNGEQRVSERGYRFGAEQSVPDIAGNYIVWQDHRGSSTAASGKRIWSKNLSTRGEAPVTTFATQHANPRISAKWVVWTDSRNGNDDIFARKLSGTSVVRVTKHPAHQMNPVVDGNIVVWEDYRNGDVDIFMKNLKKPKKREKPVVVAPGDQTSPSVSGKTIAWRDSRRGSTVADVYARTGSSAPVEIARAAGQARSLSEHQVAVSGSRLLWNEVDPATCGSDCVPKILKTCVLPCATETTVDEVSLLDPPGNVIRDLDAGGSIATWVKGGDPETHVYTVDLATCDSPPCAPPTQLDTATVNTFATGSSRTDGDRFVWSQDGGSSQGSDIFWRDPPAAPRRANSLSLGPFGTHLSPAADGDLVAYRAAGEQGTFLGVDGFQGLFKTWATDLDPRRHFAVSSVLGTDTSRPAVAGTRAVWSDLRNCTSFGTCPNDGDDIFERDPLDSGTEEQLSVPDNTGGHGDADGSNTAWRCRAPTATDPPTSICFDDGVSIDTFDLSAFLIGPSSVVGNTVRTSGDLVAWWEFFEGGGPDARLHVLNTANGHDQIAGSGVDVVGDFGDFDISGSTVLWAGRADPEDSKIWRNDVTGDCGIDPLPCFATATAVVFEEPTFNHVLSSPSIDGSRTAWVDCKGAFELPCDVYTRTLTESESHLVTNESTANVSSPFVDGDRIYWVDERSGTPDIFVESVTPTPIPGTADTTPPGPPTSFSAGPNTGSVALSWTNPADADFFRVRILRKPGKKPPKSLDDTKSTVVYEDDGASFVDTDVVSGKRYAYKIFAFDLDANFSSPAVAKTG